MRAFLVVMTAALLLAACGKKGDPLPPPGYGQPQPVNQQNQQ